MKEKLPESEAHKKNLLTEKQRSWIKEMAQKLKDMVIETMKHPSAFDNPPYSDKKDN
jgi:hypothetical protein